jgi:hypothetical protein
LTSKLLSAHVLCQINNRSQQADQQLTVNTLQASSQQLRATLGGEDVVRVLKSDNQQQQQQSAQATSDPRHICEVTLFLLLCVLQ